MTDDLPAPVTDELEGHDAYKPASEGYQLTTTVFDATVTATDGEGKRDGEFRVTIRLPALGAAVSGDDVADIVETDWFETLQRRLEDAFTVTNTTTHDEPYVEREGNVVCVTLEYVAWDAGEGVEDAKALIEFVEGTYAQGLIPGYDYQGEAATLLESAQQRGQEAAEGGDAPL
ncbi:DUF5813 family protein [Natrialbaceae archaeon A-gly3]